MPSRKYNNLQGWMRDVKHAIETGDQVAYELQELILDLDELVDGDTPSAVDAADDDSDDTPDGNQGDVESSEPDVREEVRGRTGGPVQGRRGHGAPASILDGILDNVPGDLRAQAQSELDQLRRDAVGSPVTRLTASRKPARLC